MKTWAAALLVVAGVGAGFAAGHYSWPIQPGIAPGAATPEPVAISALPPPVARWQVTESKNPITDQVEWSTRELSREGQLVLTVRCINGMRRIDFSSTHLHAESDGSFYVSYRFDQQPGVDMHQWYGAENIVSPLDMDAFAEQLRKSHTALMRIESTVMTQPIMDQHFDLQGIDSAMDKIKTGCKESVATMPTA